MREAERKVIDLNDYLIEGIDMKLLDGIKISERFKLSVLFLAILIIGGLFFSLIWWLLYKLQWWFILLMLGFYTWVAFSRWLSKRSNNMVMRAISNVISFPVEISFGVMALTQPFISIIGTYFFLILIAFGGPALILAWFTHIFNWGLFLETIGFIVIASGSILCANSYKLTQWIIKLTPLRNRGNHRYESYREKLSFYLVHPSNVIFLLYLFYFVFLIMTGFIQIQNGGNLLPGGFDAAVLKAFLVFIAFTNMKTKAKDAELDIKELYRQTMGLFAFNAGR